MKKSGKIADSIWYVILVTVLIVVLAVSRTPNITNDESWKEKNSFGKTSVYYYERDGVEIRIAVQRDSRTWALKEIIEDLDEADLSYISNCTEIYLIATDIDEEYAEDDDGTIYEREAYASGTRAYFYDIYYNSDAFYHELAHVYDNNNNEISSCEDFVVLSNDADFENIRESTAVVCDDIKEDWAVASALYWLEPETLKELDLDVYEFLQEEYGSKV